MSNELESLGDLESAGVVKDELTLSNVYSVREGGFGTDAGLKTYLTTLTVEELERDIQFYEVLSGDKDWPVSQIIQREVDKDRVNQIAKKYLLGEGREVKYFPPIIVALLPKDANGDFAHEYTFTPDVSTKSRDQIYDNSKYKSNEKFKEILDKGVNKSVVDGLFIFDTLTVLDHKLLCWDRNKFYAVVIDGQHRLEALIQGQKLNPALTKAVQDVIFIDISFLLNGKSGVTPVEILRTVFIDINTNAKTVGIVRRVLMDDKDLASLCVQSLVESLDHQGKSKDPGSFIPSVLVDWDGAGLKHELPHITGILTLYQIINDELVSDRLTMINDHRDQKKIQYFISLLNDTFFVDNIIKTNNEYEGVKTLETSFKEYLKDKEINREIFSAEVQENGLDSILFNFDYRTLYIAQETFEKYFMESMVSIFTDLIPYCRVSSKLQELGGFDPKTNLYKSLLISRASFANSKDSVLKAVYVDARKQLMELLNDNFQLVYLVVGQKAIFKCVFERIWNKYVHGVTPETIKAVVTEFVGQLNAMFELFDKNDFRLFGGQDVQVSVDNDSVLQEYNIIYLSFWEGILFEDKRVVYNSQGVRAFADVVNFCLQAMSAKPSTDNDEALLQTNIRFSEGRIKRMVKKRYDRTDDESARIANLIMLNKKQFLLDRVRAMTTVTEEDES